MKRRHWLALALCCVPATLIACGGDSGSATTDSAKTITAQTVAAGGTPGAPADTKSSPKLTAPASKYTVLHGEDAGPSFRNLPEATYVFDVDAYAKTYAFTGKDGKKLLTDWGYVGGFEESLVPAEGPRVLENGGFNFTVESHLFKDEAGAKSAYAYFEAIVEANKKNETVTAEPIGNQSSAWKLIDGKLAGTEIDRAHHQIVFRRGNLVVIVLTTGADPFMKIDSALALASIVDDKALGELPPVEPTPVSNYTPPAGFAANTPTTRPGITPTVVTPTARP